MVNKKINDLTLTAPLTAAMQFEIDTAGTTSGKVTAITIKSFVEDGFSSGNVVITGGVISGVTDLAVADGGTGTSSLIGKVIGNNTAPFTALKSTYANAVNPIITNDSSQGYAVGSEWYNTTNNKAFVCVNASIGAAIWREISDRKGTVCENFAETSSNTFLPFKTASAGASGTAYAGVVVPDDYLSIISAKAFGIAGGTGAGLNIDVTLTYFSPGDIYNATSNSDTTSTYSATNNTAFIINFTSLMTGVLAGDVIGLQISNVAIGMNMGWHSIKLEYNRSS